MTVTLAGSFDTRRDAEMAVERLVQEHGLDRNSIRIAPEGRSNSSGVERAGSDTAARGPSTPPRGDGALEGEIVVSADVPDEDTASKVRKALSEFDADKVRKS
jgi:hypothetical protein